MSSLKNPINQDTITQERYEDFDIRQYLFNDLMHKYLIGEKIDTKLKEYIINNYSLNVDNQNYCICSFKLFMHNSFSILNSMEFQKYQNFSDHVYTYIKDTSIYPVWFYKADYNTTLIIFYSVTNINDIITFITAIHDWILLEYKCESSWGISSICKNIDDIWHYAHSAITTTNCLSCGEIKNYNELFDDNDTVYYPKQLEDLIISSIKTNDSNNLDFLLQIIKDENFIIRSITKNSLATLNALIINTLYKFTTSSQSFEEYFITLNNIILNYNGNYNDYFNNISQLFHQICYLKNKQKITQKNALIKDITSYISYNYNDCSLSLTKIADTFNLSEGHISSLFKEQTKTNFTDFMEELRINEACKLLSESAKSINEIAVTVGYSNVYSFRRAFKRKLQLGPKEYRTGVNKTGY